ncbi:hypothetical protein FGO68_gene7069 [Halteria grandinella]|uniref:Uncharacterized protein n=1 Tax=Halteria grandinella TaxID=5974 RepID=A0A8J8SUK8_HALGN|nr:hypothetical protein FGO68_gene7069 [Halteria grandinella]
MMKTQPSLRSALPTQPPLHTFQWQIHFTLRQLCGNCFHSRQPSLYFKHLNHILYSASKEHSPSQPACYQQLVIQRYFHHVKVIARRNSTGIVKLKLYFKNTRPSIPASYGERNRLVSLAYQPRREITLLQAIDQVTDEELANEEYFDKAKAICLEDKHFSSGVKNSSTLLLGFADGSCGDFNFNPATRLIGCVTRGCPIGCCILCLILLCSALYRDKEELKEGLWSNVYISQSELYDIWFFLNVSLNRLNRK